uniref:Uncharacterized protein n=1 Tax=Rhizophora mucronata TaxID=61149 RepID=A0A2P2PF38_RHIMU
MDVIDPIILKTYDEHQFILVAINYFTKRVKTTSYTSVIHKVVIKFIKKDIIYCFKVPE